MKYRRDVILTWDALFATFGGIFSLCLGGSIISLIEIMYYFTFQLFFASSSSENRKDMPTATQTVSFRRRQVADKRNLAAFVRRMHEHIGASNNYGPYIE